MRDIPSGSLALLSSREQLEPVNLIAVAWTKGGQLHYYSDKGIANDDGVVVTPGKIVSLGSIDQSQRSDSSGLSGTLTITLDDRDGTLKTIFNTNDIHKQIVKVYQWFWGLPDSDKFLIFDGQISTPLIWDEGARTLTFDVVTRIEDQEVGWSAEMGNFNLVSQDLLGVGWPMVFGTVVHSPTLQLENIPTGFTTGGFGLQDQTLAFEMAALSDLLQQAILATQYFSLISTEANVQDDPQVATYVQMQVDIQAQIDQLKLVLAWQVGAGSGPVGIIPTVFVNRKFSGVVRVGSNLFTATINKFSGTLNCTPVIVPGDVAGAGLRSGFQYFPAGSQVTIADNYPLDYVVSITPGTVLAVFALRSWNGTQQLSKVPPAYYSVRHEVDGPFDTTIVTLHKPLSVIAFQENQKTQVWENNFGQSLPGHIINNVDWQDQLYVTFQSDIGPNPVDILIYFITNFTSNTYDATSFGHVHDKVATFPMNFTYTERANVLDVLTDIAYQARCVIFLREDIFFLVYLPETPTSVATLTEDDIVEGSLQVTTTSTEDLITKYTATFRPDYSPFYEKPVTAIFRFNIAKYGMHEESHDFYCYNDFYRVEKVASFWMIRKSQTWKLLKAKLLLNMIGLEVFDGVTLHFATKYIANGDVIGFVTNCTYNTEDKTIDVEIWTPVLLGTMEPNKFAWPSGLTENDIWPPYHDIGSGAGASFSGGYNQGGGGAPRLPVGVIDGYSYIEDEQATLARQEEGLAQRSTWTGGDPQPGDDTVYAGYVADNTPSVTADIDTPFTPTPGPDPTETYKYNDKPDPTIPKIANVVPGRILEYIGPDEGTNLVMYKVELYDKGLRNAPTIKKVGQLQINPTKRIPPNTWTLINTNQGTDKDTGESFTDTVMQVPVWLV